MNAARTLAVMLACTSLGRSAKVMLPWIALTSRSRVLGSPFDAIFSAAIESRIAEKMISCITSVADLVISLPWRPLYRSLEGLRERTVARTRVPGVERHLRCACSLAAAVFHCGGATAL